MKEIHKEYCPIYLLIKGQYGSTVAPTCNCDGLPQHESSSTMNHEKPEEFIRCEKCNKYLEKLDNGLLKCFSCKLHGEIILGLKEVVDKLDTIIQRSTRGESLMNWKI